MEIFKKVIDILESVEKDIVDIDVSACKISVLFNKIIDNKYLNELHKELI